MTLTELYLKLDDLRRLPTETEWVEFKHNNTNPHEIGEYVSALSNAAALHGEPIGYVVWGIEDTTRAVLGTTFQPKRLKRGNEELESWLLRLLEPRIDFTIHEFEVDQNRVVLFAIQAANSSPVRFDGEEYIRVGSYKKKLKDYREKERRLWQLLSGPKPDWSAQVVPKAALADLDPDALEFARAHILQEVPEPRGGERDMERYHATEKSEDPRWWEHNERRARPPWESRIRATDCSLPSADHVGPPGRKGGGEGL